MPNNETRGGEEFPVDMVYIKILVYNLKCSRRFISHLRSLQEALSILEFLCFLICVNIDKDGFLLVRKEKTHQNSKNF